MANTNGTTVTSGTTDEVTSGNSASNTTVQSGGTLQVDNGATETGASIQAGGVEVLLGNATSTGDDVFGTIDVGNVPPAQNTSTAVVNNVTIENGGVVALTIKGTSVNEATVLIGGSLTINGNAAANTVTLSGGLLDLQSPKADSTNTSGASAGGTLTFASGVNSRLQLDVAQTGTNGTTFAQTITGYAPGDVIELKTLTVANPMVTTTTSNGNTTVTVGGTNTGAETFTFANTPATTLFATQTDANGGTDLIETPCFATGTRIRVLRAGTPTNVAVEDLIVGDTVVTAAGAARPIRWMSHRTVDCRRHPRPLEALPIRIAAHAFAPARPSRDLVLSPGHSICVDVQGEVLIPAGALINGTSVVQDQVDSVTYWHVELDSHDILLAEDMPAESYLDMGNRGFFEGSGVVALHASPDAPASTHANFCRPFHAFGEVVERVREQMRCQAETLGWQRQTSGFDLHLDVDGVRIEPTRRGATAVFALPASSRRVWLVSDASRPTDVGPSPDGRTLGVCVGTLTIVDGFETREIEAWDERLDLGFHSPEAEGLWRWTNGRALLPNGLWEGCEGTINLRVDFRHGPLACWRRSPAGDREPTRRLA